MLGEYLSGHWIQLHALGQILIAMILGALIGFDREYLKKPAGMRTHMLVAGGSALIVKLAEIAICNLRINRLLGKVERKIRK